MKDKDLCYAEVGVIVRATETWVGGWLKCVSSSVVTCLQRSRNFGGNVQLAVNEWIDKTEKEDRQSGG